MLRASRITPRRAVMGSRVSSRCIPNIFALLGFCLITGGAHAADPPYPTRPVRLLVSFAPGGGVDATARIIAPKLSESMGHNWVVDNRTGAAGNLATEIVVRAAPDGQTVLLALDTQLTANPSLYDLPFNVQRDLQPIVVLAV